MFQKPLEYWAVLIGMALYAASRDAEREALIKRVVKTLASAFLAVGLTSKPRDPFARNFTARQEAAQVPAAQRRGDGAEV